MWSRLSTRFVAETVLSEWCPLLEEALRRWISRNALDRAFGDVVASDVSSDTTIASTHFFLAQIALAK